ncbi:transcription factor 7-like 1-B isoform X2 [Syngnathoides biaculeatus]|uniref:transcription factor 7-like 1-B isoform X2 n=1 Tax=Syngnathoides biaculeatus TaxID=300417 RepID=UPI002ADE1350|nr:transcription factor 7-like 1-B isoform X2 [Syngnathoides biaculeatus]
MPQLGDDGDLGASDELIRFRDEGERDDKRSGTAAGTDLDDVKSSLVNESESTDASASEAASRRGGTERDAPGRARYNRLAGEALRRQRTAGGLLAPSPYLGYPFFLIPDLRASYLAGGGLAAARAYFPLQWPLLDIPGRAAVRDATPAHLSSGVHARAGRLHPLLTRRPEGFLPPQKASPGLSPDAGSSRPPHVARYPVSPGGGAQMPHAFDWLQGQPTYPMTGGFSSAALAINASASGLVSSGFFPSPSASVSAAVKREPREPREAGSPRKSPPPGARAVDRKVKGHIKKPLNAFMLFMRDERPKVVAQCQVKESATINQILGQRWHSLSKDEQAKYYELARKERLLHSQLYPGWSARDNYGKKKKRKKSKCEAQPHANADDWSPEPKRPGRPLVHTRPGAVSHLTHSHLSQASPASSVGSPATPTAALASPAAPAPTSTEHTRSASCGGRASPCADGPPALAAKPPRPPVASPAPPSSSHA